jgi:hypothetical protein
MVGRRFEGVGRRDVMSPRGHAARRCLVVLCVARMELSPDSPEKRDDRPLAEPVAEANRIAMAAERAGVPLRIAGGVAVALRCPSARSGVLDRTRADIDTASRSGARRDVERLLATLGYQADNVFNSLSGETRLLFWDKAHERQLDVFLDRVQMCHTIELAARLDVDSATLSLADLLLMKLQVVQTNEKDFIDILALCTDHELTDDDSGINLRYLSALVGADWCLWRTVTEVIEAGIVFARSLSLPHDGHPAERLRDMVNAFESVPKTRRWRLRARVGERVRWYELPEEAH